MTDGEDVIHLCGQPYDREALETADRMLTWMLDYDAEGTRPWLLAARAAVRDALREDG